MYGNPCRNVQPGPELAGRAYTNRRGCARAHPSRSAAVFGTAAPTRSAIYSNNGPDGVYDTSTPNPRPKLSCNIFAPGTRILPRSGNVSACSGSSCVHSPCVIPSDSGPCPSSTKSMSTRPAPCCAFNLPANSGDGASCTL